MNNFKKIGLSALAGSLVATSAFAGEMSVAGSASINVEHTNGAGGDSGKTFSMGNSLTFTGGDTLDNGLDVALSFVLDQNDDSTTAGAAYSGGPFDSHSVTVGMDGMGSLKFSGEGGSSAVSALDGTAAGDIWDSFDVTGSITPTGVGGGDNSMMYTLPEMVENVAINASYTPRTTGADSSTSYSIVYSGITNLTASMGIGDGGDEATDGTAMKVEYVAGPITAGYSMYEYDTTGTAADNETTAYAITYLMADEGLSITYGAETIEEGTSQDVETMEISGAYTAGGMTVSVAMQTVDNLDGSTDADQDRDRWALGLSFAF
jgi:outer membrane protein OmpU